MTAIGRDAIADSAGSVRTRSCARCDLRLDGWQGVIEQISAQPALTELGHLVGHSTGHGFRKRLSGSLPTEPTASESLAIALLDDLPGASIVSSYVPIREAMTAPSLAGDPPPDPSASYANACAGWQEGGTMLTLIARTGRASAIVGPPATPLRSPDEHGWHELPPLPPNGMRRVRRLDVIPEDQGSRIDSHFRDTHRDDQGIETVLHEYSLHARLDRGGRIKQIVAVPHVLPLPECPAVVSGVSRLVGQHIADVASAVRQDFRPSTSCTHLNDMLRQLAAVPWLGSYQATSG
ncbi:DUF2889 domain-containing protein [Nocardioides marmoriginsengisoli]|nr:DUF2889 domain-containing protein [Nocardioides marmoriginsengisoli]